LIAACGEPTSTPRSVADDAQIEALLGDFAPQTTRPREAALIAASGAVVAREGETLVFDAPHGEPVKMTSNMWCPEMDITEESCVEYILVADLPSRGAYVVQQAFYDSNDFVVVDAKTGAQTRVATPPQFSADGEYFIVVGFDLADGADSYGLEVYRRNEAGAASEWRLMHGDEHLGRVASARVLNWDKDGIAMEFDPGEAAPKWLGTIKKAGDSWRLVKG